MKGFSGRLLIVSDERTDWKRWQWIKVARVHWTDDDRAKDRPSCDGAVYSHAHRTYEPESASYERCISLEWCGSCRTYSGAMVHIPRDRASDDPLDLGNGENRMLRNSEVRVVDDLDRLVRRGAWLPTQSRTKPQT